MAQKESAGEAKASAGSPGSPVPDSSAFDLDSPTQTDSTTPQQHAVDLSNSTSDTQLQSDSTGIQRILPPINQPNLFGDRNNPPSPLKPEKDAVVKDGIPVPKSNKGDGAGSSSSSESSKDQSEKCRYCSGTCLASQCQKQFPTLGDAHRSSPRKRKGSSSSYGPIAPSRSQVQAADAISLPSAPKPTAFPTSSPQAGITSESSSSYSTMNPSPIKVQAAEKAISLPSAPKPTAFPTSSLQAGQTSESSSSSGTMNPSPNQVQAAEKAISVPSAPTQTALPTSFHQAKQTSGSSSSQGAMNPSLNQVQAAEKATSMPSAPAPTTTPPTTSRPQDDIISYGRGRGRGRGSGGN